MCRRHNVFKARCDMAFKTIINGIDIERQRAAGADLFHADVTATTDWLGGTQTRTSVTTAARRGAQRDFTIDADYPDWLLGSGLAASPDELFLASLGSSFVTSFVLAAAAADVRIESMRVVATRSTAAVAAGTPDPTSASSGLELHCEVGAEAVPADLERLLTIAKERSSVMAACGSNVVTVLKRAPTAVEHETRTEVRR